MPDREVAVRYAWAYIGRWYKWGGDDPAGFDCSGLASEVMQAVGKLRPGERLTAHGLYSRFLPMSVSDAVPGCLVLYLDAAGHAFHVEICLRGVGAEGPVLAIGAKGGGPSTLTEADAIRDNAFIKVRPVYGRKAASGTSIVFLDPFAEHQP